MGFILVPKQVDVSNPDKKCDYITEEPKIPLKVGTHLIGRQKFLHCDDKRMSRQHAKLEVTDDLVTFIGLHKNPCFYLKKGGKIQKLEQSQAVQLHSGDMFGVLPNKCWYEVIHVPDDMKPGQKLTETEQEGDTLADDSNKTAMLDSTEVNNADVTALHANTQLPDNDDGRPSSPNISDQSQSLLQDVLTSHSEPSLVPNHQATEKNTSEQVNPVKVKTEKAEPVQPSPLKRPLPELTSEVKTEHRDDVTKKIKTEPDAIPGSSHGQNGSVDASALPPSDGTSTGDGSASTAPLPPSPAKPRVRERCMYGAICYRKNPVHKAEFSHPSDADWGAGEPGACPHGARCQRRHPRHWQQYSHPPDSVPPHLRPQPQQQQGKTQRRKTKRYSSGTDSEEGMPDDVIVTGKRARKTRDVQKWSDSDATDEDPFGTDDEDEWKPTDTQQYTQDTLDD